MFIAASPVDPAIFASKDPSFFSFGSYPKSAIVSKKQVYKYDFK